MNSLTQYLSPKNPDGSVDQRYSETTKRMMDMLGPEGLDAVNALIEGQLTLANKHGWVGSRICDLMYGLAKDIEDKEDHVHRWKSKKLRKAVQNVLEGIGLTSSQVSFIIKAKQFKEKLQFEAFKGRKPKISLIEQLNFIESYGPRAQYTFSLMDSAGIRKALKDSKTKGEPLSVRELEAIKSLHPKAPRLNIVHDDSSATSEVLSPSKADKARQFRDLAIELHTDDAWKDTEIIEILSPIQKELFYIAHVASQPVHEPITI